MIFFCQHLPGIRTVIEKERTQHFEMNTKITDKNLKELDTGEKDAELGITLPSALGVDDQSSAGGHAVKEEVPSLPLLKEQMKTIKKAYLLMSHMLSPPQMGLQCEGCGVTPQCQQLTLEWAEVGGPSTSL